MSPLDVLIPTRNRSTALALTLLSLEQQTHQNFWIVIADQSDDDSIQAEPPLSTVLSLLALHGKKVSWHRNIPPRGLAHQRQFLVEHSSADYCLLLDDDVLLEPFVLDLMLGVIHKERCGFVGQGLIALSYLDDIRPEEQHFERWNGPVQPETVSPESPAWQRYTLHNAANVWHAQQEHQVSVDAPLLYKVAWIGGCVLYDRKKLEQCGAFSFWQELPSEHVGEDVLAQLRVMKQFGGCGILPSGAYHQELPTTIPNREVDAPRWLNL